MLGVILELSKRVFTKRLGVRKVAQPNGWRLSCGAKLKCSQTEPYHRRTRAATRLVGQGRRQLQARVRQRACKTTFATANLRACDDRQEQHPPFRAPT